MFNFHDEEINYLLYEINSIQTPNLRREKYNRIAEIYKEEIPFISLYFNANILIHNTNLRGNMIHNWHNIFHNIETWHRIYKLKKF